MYHWNQQESRTWRSKKKIFSNFQTVIFCHFNFCQCRKRQLKSRRHFWGTRHPVCSLHCEPDGRILSINQGVFLPYNFWSIYEEICHCVLLKEASFIAAKLYSVFIPGRVLYLSVRILFTLEFSGQLCCLCFMCLL